jgi:hypothetical protein
MSDNDDGNDDNDNDDSGQQHTTGQQNALGHSEYYSFVLPGHPLTLNSGPLELDQARNLLMEQVHALNLPVPVSANPQTPVELHAVFHFPTSVDADNNDDNVPVRTRDMLDISRELTIGILYTDNTSVAAKSVRRALRAIDGDSDIGCTRIKFRLLDASSSIQDIGMFSGM